MRRPPFFLVLSFTVLLTVLPSGCGENPDRRLEAGDALLDEGRLDDGLAEYERALEIDPDHTAARLRIAALYLLRYETDAAIEALKPVLDEEPEHPQALLLWGQALVRRGELEAALEKLRRAADAAPDWATPRSELGVVFARLERFEEAEAAFEEAAAIEPRMPGGTLAHWGFTLENLDRVREARQKLETALELEPDNAEALLALGRIHLRHGGDVGEGIRLLEGAMRQRADDPRILHLLGEAYLAAERFTRAHNLLQRAVSQTPEDDPGLAARQRSLEAARRHLPRQAPRDDMPNLLLVVLDSVRADHLGLYGYERSTSPHLDRLAEEAVVFENAVSQAPWTAPSVASLLTGLYPSVHGIDRGVRFVERDDGLPFVVQKSLAPSQLTLAEALNRRGYATAGFVSNAFLSSVFGFANGFEIYHDERGDYPRDARTGKRRGDVTNRHVFDWLEDTPTEPFLLFVHYNDAHWPYDPPPPFGEAFIAGYDGSLDPSRTGFLVEPQDRSDRPPLDAEDVAYLVGLYDGEIRTVDHHLAALRRRIDAAKLERPLITVVLADHGEEFFDHGGTSHGYTLFEEQIRVPLLIHAPGRLAPRRIETPIRLVDLMPTLLELGGIEPPTGIQGNSLLPLIEGKVDAVNDPVFAEGTLQGTLRALRTADGMKMIQANGASPRLFDLETDPAEHRDLAAENATAREDLLRKLESLVESNDTLRLELFGDEDGYVVVDEELQEELRALGYIQ